MAEKCERHPEREALSSCHSCGSNFCEDCLLEGVEYYYCKNEGCQQALSAEMKAFEARSPLERKLRSIITVMAPFPKEAGQPEILQKTPQQKVQIGGSQWKELAQKGKIVRCYVESDSLGPRKMRSFSPSEIIESSGYFKKAELGVVGDKLFLRTLLDSKYDQDIGIPLQEINRVSCRVIGRGKHVATRMLHFLGIGGGIGTVFMITFLFRRLQGESDPLILWLFFVIGPLVGGAFLGILLGLVTGKANEVTLSTTSEDNWKIYIKKKQMQRLATVLGEAGIQWTSS